MWWGATITWAMLFVIAILSAAEAAQDFGLALAPAMDHASGYVDLGGAGFEVGQRERGDESFRVSGSEEQIFY